jgi:hypothetical protein
MRPEWGDECMTDAQNAERTTKYLANLEQAGQDWEASAKADRIAYLEELGTELAEGLPVPMEGLTVSDLRFLCRQAGYALEEAEEDAVDWA